MKKIKSVIIKIMSLMLMIPYKLLNIWVGILSKLHRYFKILDLGLKNSYLDEIKTDIFHLTDDRKVDLTFYTPNRLCLYRAESFSSKEPETLEWIEEYGKGGAVLFDVGANVGLYSIYHSVLNKGETIAFEPSFFNLKLLLKNININSCQKLVTIVSTPLSSDNGINEFKYSHPVEGGALSAFGVDYGYNGKTIESDLSAKVIGMSLDTMLNSCLIRTKPNLVKIDVDGIEHIILSGASDTLKHPDCRSILIEVNDQFEKQASMVHKHLTNYGFILRNKAHSDDFDNSKLYSSSYNQIWVKNS